ncbi:MAG TPA: hypothetical protein ENK06_02880 [Gammaproteobacteria bacterium]|nr:hypothetical protein [Gammaproteobacteria bacterium]
MIKMRSIYLFSAMSMAANANADQHYVSVDFDFMVWLFILLLATVLTPFMILFIVRYKKEP